jgi:hypothetical protein
MKIKRLSWHFSVLITLALLLAQVEPALADGGLVVPPDIWAMIDEGQQPAVVQLQDANTVLVDLFITMVDRSGKSHQVVFFIPLGQQSSNFNVLEERSLDFDEALTKELDEQIRAYGEQQATYKNDIRAGLILGTLATNGLWTWLISLPLLSAGCAGAPTPKATFATESSTISIYALDQSTSINDLITASGLDPSVRQTLENLRGQEIAVVRLQTQVEAETQDWQTKAESRGQPGIHLTWVSTLVNGAYTYPLGTGRAWASPIELTRVYVVAPRGSDFSAQYPRLGADLTGMEGGGWLGWGSLAGEIYWRIDRATSPAYSIDEGFGKYGHIWRATFVKSNSNRDIIITRLAEMSAETRAAIRQSQFQSTVTHITWLVSLLIGAVLWLTTWWFVMNLTTGAKYRWKEGRLYGDAFTWSVLYPLIILYALVLVGLVAISFLALYSALEQFDLSETIAYVVLGLPLVLVLAGVVNAFFFSRQRAARLGISRVRAFGAYMLTVLLANVGYALYAILYAMAVRAV